MLHMYSFIVLPALALYIALAYAVASAAYGRAKSVPLKIVYPLLVLAIMAFLPFADIVYPRWKLSQLCATEAKTEILATTTLPAEYFSANGNLVARQGNSFQPDWARLRNVLRFESTGSELASTGVHKSVFSIIDVRTKTVLIQQIWFNYRGGWLRTSSAGFGAKQCPPDVPIEQVLERAIKRGA